MDYRAALMTGVDIPMTKVPLVLSQPSIKELSMIGESDFFSSIQTICLYKSMFEKSEFLENHSEFEIFINILNEKEAAERKQNIMKILSLVFPQYKIQFTPRSMMFIREQETIMIDSDSFGELQEILRDVFCLNTASMDQRNFNPANDKAREIAEKLMKGRQKVAEQKGEANASVFQQYISSISVGLHIPINYINDYTMFQLYDQVERYGLWAAWDIDKGVRLAGGTPDSEPENWMKNIH